MLSMKNDTTIQNQNHISSHSRKHRHHHRHRHHRHRSPHSKSRRSHHSSRHRSEHQSKKEENHNDENMEDNDFFVLDSSDDVKEETNETQTNNNEQNNNEIKNNEELPQTPAKNDSMMETPNTEILSSKIPIPDLPPLSLNPDANNNVSNVTFSYVRSHSYEYDSNISYSSEIASSKISNSSKDEASGQFNERDKMIPLQETIPVHENCLFSTTVSDSLATATIIELEKIKAVEDIEGAIAIRHEKNSKTSSISSNSLTTTNKSGKLQNNNITTQESVSFSTEDFTTTNVSETERNKNFEEQEANSALAEEKEDNHNNLKFLRPNSKSLHKHRSHSTAMLKNSIQSTIL